MSALNYRLFFILNFLVCFLVMKALAWALTPEGRRPGFFGFLFGWPYLSPRSLAVRAPQSASPPALSLLLFLGLMGLVFSCVKIFLSPVGYWDRVLLGPGIFFFTEALGALGQTLYFRRRIFPIHYRPLASPSLSEFWGRRWNLWVQDWIRDMGRPFRGHKTKIFASFLVSGLFHEAMVNFPHWVLERESYFGTMLGYFGIQGIGLYLDKKLFRHGPPMLRRLFGWLVVALPAPLFISVPALRFFGMTE